MGIYMRILHMFNWDLKDIIKEVESIKAQGFDAIQINPIQPLKEDNKDNWWLSYQPCGFNIGNQYGTRQDLINLCNACNYFDIKVIADVICNHVAGDIDGSLNAHQSVDANIKNNEWFFKEKKQIQNWDDRYQVTEWCMGLPSLNLDNYDLQDIVFVFLVDLVNCGVSGFRFDAAKCMKLPNEGSDFLQKVKNMSDYLNLYNYGEVINEHDHLIDQYSQYFKVATDNYNGHYKDNIVSYVESHDCYLEFGYTKNKPSSLINHEYYNLTNEYGNTLYYARPFDNAWKDEIVRKANYVNKKHHVMVLKRVH